MPHVGSSLEQFTWFHTLLVKTPFCWIDKAGSVLGLQLSGLEALSPLLDLPVLFYPFMNESFHFESDLVAVGDFDGRQYSIICASSAIPFMRSRGSSWREASRLESIFNRQLRIGGLRHCVGAQDATWALTQPRGNYAIRLIAYIFIKVLRLCCEEVTVDLGSFAGALSARKDSAVVLLAPTHRSFLDFILISYLCFAVPELNLELPHIAAAEDFKKLPFFGVLAGWLKVFFVKRGRGQIDPHLSRIIQSIEKQSSRTVIEVFLEGKRSRDRRFVEPKTGLLRCLRQTKDEAIFVPIAISYEIIADQCALSDEAEGGNSNDMSLLSMVQWLRSVAKGEVRLGKIHIAAGGALTVNGDHEYNEVALELQRRQSNLLCVSDYHIEATAKLLGIGISDVDRAFERLGCPMWAKTCKDRPKLFLPEDRTELCTIMLQSGPWLAPVFADLRPAWSKWLNHFPSQAMPDISDQLSPVSRLRDALLQLFDAADESVDRACQQLGFVGVVNPTRKHVMQIASKHDISCPGILIWASVAMKVSDVGLEQELAVAQPTSLGSVLRSKERLGFWGFSDSSFVVRLTRYGVPYVTMRGHRYEICGRKISKLLPFIEKETETRIDPRVEAFAKTPTNEIDAKHAFSGENLTHLNAVVAEVSVDVTDRLRHGSGHGLSDVFAVRSGQSIRIPDAVAWLSSEKEAEGLVKLAQDRDWCLIPYGGGTNVSGATMCPSLEREPRPIISVDMTKMNAIIWLSEENGVANIEAGITGRALVSELERRGFTMGHEPDSIEFSTLGGWVATKASGMKRSRYGNIEDMVKAVRLVSGKGVLWHGDPGEAAWGRESTGLDLISLALGSEGCFGIITSVVVRIWPVPEVKKFQSVLLPDMNHGLRFVRDVARSGRSMPASCRLLDNAHFRLGQALRPDAETWLESAQQAVAKLALKGLYNFDTQKVVCATISFEGERREVADQEHCLTRLVRQHGGLQLGSRIGKAGYETTFMIAYLRDFALTYHYLGESFETFAPWSRVEEIIRLTKDRIRKEHAIRCLPGIPFVGCRVTQLYHEGACLYFYLCMNYENVPNPCQVFNELEHAAREEILNLGGSLSHHHGVGKVRSSFMERLDSPAFLGARQAVKAGLDPGNIFGACNGSASIDIVATRPR